MNYWLVRTDEDLGQTFDGLESLWFKAKHCGFLSFTHWSAAICRDIPFMLTCALSGESLALGSDDVVVTPSGHLCSKRIVLQKLSENNNVDPFNETEALTPEQLITVKSAVKLAPPRNGSSFSSLMHQIQLEYDAVLLELVDTRKALQETRQELSTALYQNDAAIRVIARLTKERDQQLSVNGTDEQPTMKKRRLEEASSLVQNDIPERDSQEMLTTWETLHKSRKSRQKESAASAPTPQALNDWAIKATIPDAATAVSQHGSIVATAAANEWNVYHMPSQKPTLTHKTDRRIVAIAVSDKYVAVGFETGRVEVWSQNAMLNSFTIPGEHQIIDVRLHPDDVHIVVATRGGRILIARVEEGPVAVFTVEGTLASSGALHPDGLIYIAGTTTGDLLVWDFKSKTLASTLKSENGSAVMQICFSNNGYHVAVAFAEGNAQVWDLRKQSILATLNASPSAICFDPSGKYLATAAEKLEIVAAKEWNQILASFEGSIVGIGWGDAGIVALSSQAMKFVF